MASGTTLRFSVEVAADQAEQALKAMTLAFDQAGVKAKSALGGIGKAGAQAAGGIEQLKQGMGKARETAMFFTQSLGEFGPSGRTAQIALAGVGGAIMGGGGLLLALSLAQAGVRLLVDYWEEDAKTAAEAAKKHQEAADALTKYNQALIGDANSRLGTLLATRDGLVGVTEKQKAHNEVLKINQDLQLATAPAIQATLRIRLKEAQAIEAQINGLVKKAEAEKAAADAAAARERKQAQHDSDGQKALDARARKYEQKKAEEVKADRDATAALDKALEKHNADGQKALDARARRYEKDQQDRAKLIQEDIANYQQLGDQIGTMMGGLITGQMTMGQVVAQVGQMIVQSVVNTAIANVTAKAMAAGAGAAESQASVPVIGPVLAIGAMGAMVSAVLALLGNMPSAAGGWKVPNDTLAMVHKDERILPARYSEGLDRLVNQGGGSAPTVINIHAVDASSFRRLLLDNGPALAEAIGKASRDGRRFT